MSIRTTATGNLCAAIAAIFASPVVAQEKPPVTMTYLAGPEPTRYKMDNDLPGGAILAGIPWLINKGRNGSMASNLSVEMNRREPKFAEQLHTELRAHLTKAGIALADGPSIDINPEKPWNVKYSSIDLNGKPMLYAYIESIGIRSLGFDKTYQPVLYVYYCIVLPRDKKSCSYNSRAAFGDGNANDDHLTHAAPLKYRWRDETDVYQNVGLLEEALRGGISKLASGVSQEVLENLAEEAQAQTK